MDATEFLFYVFMFTGYLTLIGTTVIPAAVGKKLQGTDFMLQVSIPSTIAIAFIGIAFIGLNWNSGDEFKLSLMTIATVVGGMGISLTAIMMAMNRIRWASPN